MLLAGGRIQLVDEAEACPAGGEVASHRCPDVAVIDLDRANEQSWVREIGLIRTRCPATAIVGVASSGAVEVSARAAGVDVFMSKLVTAEDMCEAVDRAVRQGDRGPSR
jgi:hypothetical protein